MCMQETSFDDLITVHIVSLLPPQNIWLLDELNKVGKMPWEISLNSDSKGQQESYGCVLTADKYYNLLSKWKEVGLASHRTGSRHSML